VFAAAGADDEDFHGAGYNGSNAGKL
jgi:hypothetical protein